MKEIGFDTVEIPCFDLDDVNNYAKWGKRFDALGLYRTGTAIRGPEQNPMSPDPAMRRKGIEANKRNLDCCAAAGCSVMAGPFHSALGQFSGKGPTSEEWKWAVDSMREVAEHAQKVGVMLGLEYLNRFECYLLNTAAAGAQFCCDVGHPYCKMMYDTFHAHIEEKNIPQAIRTLQALPGPRPHFGERPQHAWFGQRALGGELRHLARNWLRRHDGRRGLRPGPGKARPRHEDLASDVPERTSTRYRLAEIHEGRSRPAVVTALA